MIRATVPGRLQKLQIPLVGYFGLVQIEGVDVNLLDWPVVAQRVRIIGQVGVAVLVGPAARVLAAGNKNHTWLGGECHVCTEEAERENQSARVAPASRSRQATKNHRLSHEAAGPQPTQRRLNAAEHRQGPSRRPLCH